MADLDANYDIDHRADAIANHQNGTLVCLAGPGTGKTYSFLQRIRTLTTERNVAADEICYLTFIKEISKAFIADYEENQNTEVDDTHRPRISTLHSFACRLIRNQGYQYGFDGPLYFMNIADSTDYCSRVFLNDLLSVVKRGSLQTVPQLGRVLEKAKEAWRDNVDPATLAEPVPAVLPLCLDLSRAYRLIDWDHAVAFAHTLLQSPGGLPRWITSIRHFLVDEYQDFNRSEQAFIDTLRTIAESMVIVGDDDQSLYSSRGGSPDGLRELYHSDSVNQISLVRCFRCKSAILDVANTFLSMMRPDPRRMLPQHNGGEVTSHSFKNAEDEIEYLATFLNDCVTALPDRPRPKDGVVCLFPSWRILDYYMTRLVESAVHCCSRKSPILPKRAWLERALELVYNPGQRFVERLLLERFSEIKPRHKQAMVELMLERDISPVEAISVLASTGELTGTAISAAQAFRDLCQALSSQDPDLVANKLREQLAIESPELREQVRTSIRQLDKSDQEDAINALCDTLIPESAPPPVDLCAVLCLTMHGSKGLTKRTVVMPGLEDAWLPGDATENEMDERKKLFYVALTRATDQVLITYPRMRPYKDPLNYGAPGSGRVSRFVNRKTVIIHR